jgi:hypothetical protein
MSDNATSSESVDATRRMGDGASSSRHVRLSLTLREFALPPVRDGVVIGKRAAIGPRGLFEALDRMLPGIYELVSVTGHEVVEAVIVRKSRFRLVERERLVRLCLRHAEPLMDDSTVMEVVVEGEILIRVEHET